MWLTHVIAIGRRILCSYLSPIFSHFPPLATLLLQFGGFTFRKDSSFRIDTTDIAVQKRVSYPIVCFLCCDAREDSREQLIWLHVPVTTSISAGIRTPTSRSLDRVLQPNARSESFAISFNIPLDVCAL